MYTPNTYSLSSSLKGQITRYPLPAVVEIVNLFFSFISRLSDIKLLGPMVNSFSCKNLPFSLTGTYSIFFNSFKLKIIW